jgi:hypothetical protein
VKRIALLIAVTIWFTACQPAANMPAVKNSNDSANSNTAKPAGPAGPAPTVDALVALETKAFAAWKNHDGKFFDGFLADNFIGLGPGGPISRADSIAAIADPSCTVTSFSLSDPQMILAGADAAILTLKATQDATCGGVKQPAATWSASVYVRRGDDWKVIYHNEIPVGGAKSKPPPSAASSAPASAPPPDRALNPLIDVEMQGWDAWRDRNPQAMEPIIAKDFVLLDPGGQRSDRAGAFKLWFQPKCDVKSTALSDFAGASLGPDAGLLIYQGKADGKCEGTALTPLWGTTVFVKEGDAFKAAMIIEMPV